MDRNKLFHFRNRLIEEKKNLIKSLKNLDREEFGSMDMYYTELSGYDNHPGDIGTEVFFMEQDRGFRNNIDDTLKEIDISLENIENGSFGICEICNKGIDEERLELIPYLKTCVECSEENSTPEDIRLFESINDKYIISHSNNPEENTGYDREDAYQDVAYYDVVPGDPSFSTGDHIGYSNEDETDGVEEVERISQEYYEDTLS